MLSQACYAFAAFAGLANIAAIAKFSIDLKKQCEDYKARHQSIEVIDTAIPLRSAALLSISTDSDHEEQVIQVTESEPEMCDEHVLGITNRIPGAFPVLPAVAEEVVPGDQYAQATPSNEATTPHTALSEYPEHALEFPEHLVCRSSPRIPQESFITNASPRDTVGQHREVEQPSLLPDPSPSRYSELDPDASEEAIFGRSSRIPRESSSVVPSTGSDISITPPTLKPADQIPSNDDLHASCMTPPSPEWITAMPLDDPFSRPPRAIRRGPESPCHPGMRGAPPRRREICQLEPLLGGDSPHPGSADPVFSDSTYQDIPLDSLEEEVFKSSRKIPRGSPPSTLSPRSSDVSTSTDDTLHSHTAQFFLYRVRDWDNFTAHYSG